MPITTKTNVLAKPFTEIARSANITFREKKDPKGGVWYNLERCPICGHNGFQCGVHEAPARGGFVHAARCWHDVTAQGESGAATYRRLLLSLGVVSSSDLVAIDSASVAGRERASRPAETGRPPASEFLKKRMRRLRQSAAAQAWLAGRQLTQFTADRFYLGLSESYENRRTGEVQCDALTFPILGADGRYQKRNGFYNIPGLTQTPLDDNGWMPGSALSYYNEATDGRTTLLIVEGPKDLWRLDQFLREAGGFEDVVLLTSTHGKAQPEEWLHPAFWARWDRILLGHDADAEGDRIALRVAEMAARDTRRVRVPEGKDWTDWLNMGRRSAAAFRTLLDSAAATSLPMVSVVAPDVASDAVTPGRHSYDPVDLASAFRHGHLYYATETLVRDEEGPGEYLETVVVRSDRTLHHAKRMPTPKGVHESRAVIRLVPDGALLERFPTPSSFATWRWSGIQEFLENRNPPRPLATILADVEGHLRAGVWLPYEEDYAILSVVVVATYLQAIFPAVPLLLVVGPKGTGKTALGRVMHDLCGNSSLIGQASAATIARLIDQSRGFVVLDDLEGVAAKSDNAQFSDLVQALKLSYNQKTAVKHWTDPKTWRTTPLNFFGIKLINNTQGVDEILGSRMLTIQTRRMPNSIGRLPAPPVIGRADLRQELHRWAFEHVREVATEYQKLPSATDRDAEIAMPLQAIANVAGDPSLEGRLAAALAGSTRKRGDSGNPLEVLDGVVRRLASQGFRKVSPTHVSLEMAVAMDPNYDRSNTTEIPLWQRTEWVGRHLRILDLVDQSVDEQRIRLHGASLRFLTLRRGLIDEILAAQRERGIEPEPGVPPTSFCLPDRIDGGSVIPGCQECPYRAVHCSIREKRLPPQEPVGLYRRRR